MSEPYVDIMLQSLKKKEQVLDRIIQLNRDQRIVLEDKDGSPEAFDNIVEEKADLIEQLQQLDSGFEKLFERMKEELEANKSVYRDQIKEMQKLIKSVTDKSVEIQSQEARNKELMTQKFAMVKKQVRTVKKSTTIASKYYKNMAKINLIDSQFLDNKN